MKFFKYLEHYAKKWESRPFLVWNGHSLSYGEAEKQVEEKSVLFAPAKEKVLGIRLSSPAEQMIAFLAAERAGAVPLLIHEYIEGEELEHLLAVRPIHFLYSGEERKGLFPVPGGNWFGEIREENVRKDGIAVLTSGTSGPAKIFFRREESWSDFFPVQNRLFGIDSDSVLFLQGSMAFTGNLNMFLAFLSEGCTIAGTDRLFPRTWLKEINRIGATHVYMIPSKLSPLSRVKGEGVSVRRILSGSQLMTGRLLDGLERVFPRSETVLYYGSSEMSYVSFIRGREIRVQPDCVGRPFPGVKIAVENGFIEVDTPYGAEGIPRPFRSGDRGRLDREGCLHFLGRQEDFYNIKGNHVSRQKVLSYLLMADGVEEAEILPEQTEEGMTRLAAYVAGRQLPDHAELIRFLSQKLKAWEIPSRFVRVKEIPKTSTGKTDRKKLAETGASTAK